MPCLIFVGGILSPPTEVLQAIHSSFSWNTAFSSWTVFVISFLTSKLSYFLHPNVICCVLQQYEPAAPERSHRSVAGLWLMLSCLVIGHSYRTLKMVTYLHSSVKMHTVFRVDDITDATLCGGKKKEEITEYFFLHPDGVNLQPQLHLCPYTINMIRSGKYPLWIKSWVYWTSEGFGKKMVFVFINSRNYFLT